MAITYERTMKLTYQLNEGVEDKQIMGRFLNELHLAGVSLMDNSWDGEPSSNLGFQTRTKVNKQTVLTINGKLIDIYPSQTTTETRHILDQLLENGFEAGVNEVVSESVTEGYGVPEGSYVFCTFNDYAGRTIHYDESHMEVRIFQDSYGDNDLVIKFTMTWSPEKVAKKAEIEHHLVDIPLEDMGYVQSVVETNLGILGWDNEEPVIDCHFDAKTETRSECAPDIIQRVRDARKAQGEQNNEEE
tara:strand:- start:4277 stop:5011 length:735 start_codon:yes stop_codon:yes gene_type:complete